MMIMIILMIIIIICCCPVTKSCPALCDSMDCSPQDTPSFTTSWEFAQTHVLWVVTPSTYLILCCPLLLLPSIFPSIRVFSSELALCFKVLWSKYWSFSISSSNEYSGFIPLGLTGLISLMSKGSQESSSVSQFENINFLALSLLYGPTVTSIHGYWENHSFD